MVNTYTGSYIKTTSWDYSETKFVKLEDYLELKRKLEIAEYDVISSKSTIGHLVWRAENAEAKLDECLNK